MSEDDDPATDGDRDGPVAHDDAAGVEDGDAVGPSEPAIDAEGVADPSVIDDAFGLYAAELEPIVPEFVTVPDGVATDEAEAWAVQVLQFGYALGAVSGARVATDADDPGFSRDRVETVIDHATDAIGRHGVYDEAAFRS